MDRPWKVLICEDDPAMLRIFQFLLEQQGIQQFSTTGEGGRVVTLARNEQPDLILLDLMLPDRNGIDVIDDLKADAATRAIPIIVVSGKEAKEQVDQAMNAGAIDYIIKPFEPIQLGIRIKHFLESMLKLPPDFFKL